MRFLDLPDDVDDVEARTWASWKAKPVDPEEWLGSELVAEELTVRAGGVVVGYYRPGAVPVEWRTELVDGLRGVNKHGTGIRSNGTRTRSRPFGARPRYVLKSLEYCGEFALNREHPELLADLAELGSMLSSEYAVRRPDLWTEQVERVAATIAADYLLATPFTSGIVNFDNPLDFHRDNGNLSDSWNAMVCLRDATVGGELVVPAWGVKFAADDGDLLLLDAGATTHGVTPTVKLHTAGYRTSIVFYCLAALAQCGTCEEERVRAARIRTEREDRRAGLIE